MSTAKGFTLQVIGSQSVSEPFSRERGVGQGCALAPLLFALAIEPLSHKLKQTMSGIHIHHIHVHQQAPRGVVAMCAHHTTIICGGLDDIAHAKGKPISVTWTHHQHPSTGSTPHGFCVAT